MGPNQRAEFAGTVESVGRLLEAETYNLDIRVRADHVVQSASIGFPGLLFELGVSPHRTQKISVKIELDTNPPVGAATETTVVRRHVLLNLLHYDRPSLFAGKLHALITRPYVKGRDVYDLLWYLSDRSWPEPNLQLLRALLHQTGHHIEQDIKEWRVSVADRIRAMKWDSVIADVRPFLERSHEIELLTRENVLSLL